MTTSAATWAAAAEDRLLDAALALVPDLGWTWAAIRRAAPLAQLSEADAELLLPGGPKDLAALFSRRLDQMMQTALAEVDPGTLKVRARILRAAQARLDACGAHEAAARRCAGFLALPQNMALGLRLQWESADALWRWAGDKATDENHYSKRAILSAILASALAVRLSGGKAAADAYLAARIDDVMTFEKWKAGLPKADPALQAASALGRLRFGAGHKAGR